MRRSLHVFTTVLAAGVSIVALTGTLSGPAVADTPVPQGDIGQQQSRVSELESENARLNREIREIGGGRTPQQSMKNVEGRMDQLTQRDLELDRTVQQMGQGAEEVKQLRDQVANESVIGLKDVGEEVIEEGVEGAIKEGLSKGAGKAVGIAGLVADVIEYGGKFYVRWRTKSSLGENVKVQQAQMIDILRIQRATREQYNQQLKNRERLKDLTAKERVSYLKLLDERAKLQRMTKATQGVNPEREFDQPGDDKLREESREYWRERNKFGVTKSNQISFGGGYHESDAPQQFIGRIVVGGDDTAMIYTSPTLAGFYAEAKADVWDTGLRYAGDFGGFRVAAAYSDVEGDEYRRVEADPTITTGFVWIDPLDSGTPFAVGLGAPNLTWDARTSTNQIDAAATAIYMEYRRFSPDLTGGLGVGVMADYRNTEHRTRIENLDFAGFAVDENYDFETFGLGPRIEAMLDWDCDPEADGPFPSFGATFRAHAAATYDWRSSEISQRATGPFFGGFDYRQRVNLDDDGLNLRYGIDATFDLKFDARTTAFLKVGWQGQSDAPTIIPADGSFAPGAPIRADTADASEWFLGAGLRIEF